jgi:hypothetical protein
MLQVFHLDVLHMFAMATHMFSSFFWSFASVSDVCCKCFICFGRMLQVFYLNVAKVDRVLHSCNGTHLPHPPAATAGAPPWVTARASEADRRIRGAASTSRARRLGPTWVPACGRVSDKIVRARWYDGMQHGVHVVGRVKTSDVSFACGASSHAKDRRRPIFWSGSRRQGANNSVYGRLGEGSRLLGS